MFGWLRTTKLLRYDKTDKTPVTKKKRTRTHLNRFPNPKRTRTMASLVDLYCDESDGEGGRMAFSDPDMSSDIDMYEDDCHPDDNDEALKRRVTINLGDEADGAHQDAERRLGVLQARKKARAESRKQKNKGTLLAMLGVESRESDYEDDGFVVLSEEEESDGGGGEEEQQTYKRKEREREAYLSEERKKRQRVVASRVVASSPPALRSAPPPDGARWYRPKTRRMRLASLTRRPTEKKPSSEVVFFFQPPARQRLKPLLKK